MNVTRGRRPLAVDFIKRLGPVLGQPDHFGGADAKAFGFEVGDDFPGVASRDGVRFYDR